MAPACVKLWTRCLQDLQQLAAVDHDPAALVVTAVKVDTTLAQWQELPPLSARDWRKLVLEVKVPEMLFAVCCSAVQHSGVQGLTAAAITAFPALYEFFHKGTLQGGFNRLLQSNGSKGLDPSIAHSTYSSSTSTSSKSNTPSSSSSASSLVPGIRSQVLQSGLMGAFATAMAAATDELLRYPPYQQPAVGTSTAAAGARHLDHVLYQNQCMHFTRLLRTWHWVCELWAAGREQASVIAIAAPAAVQLSAAIMQVVSRDLPAAVKDAAAGAPPQSRGSEDQAEPSGAVGSAISIAEQLCSAVTAVQITIGWLSCLAMAYLCSNEDDMPELRPLLAMPEFTTVLATILVLMSQALLARQWLGPSPAAIHNTSNRSNRSSSNGGGGKNCSDYGAAGSSRHLPTSSQLSSSSSSTAARRSTVSTSSGISSSLFSTKVTQKLEAALQDLPECTKALLKALGMDSRAMVWAAAAKQEQADILLPSAVTTALARVLERQPDVNQRQQQLLFLVPAMLLHWASNIPIKDPEQAQESAAIASGSCRNLINRLCLSFAKQSAQQRDADQQENAAAEGPKPVTPAELKQVLPDIQKVLAMLLQHPWEHQPPSLPSSNAELQAAEYCRAPGLLVRLQCRILQSAVGRQELDKKWTFADILRMFIFGVAGGRSCSSSSTVLQPAEAQLPQPLAEFRSVTVQTLASLEAFIRASAQQLAAGSMRDALPVAVAVAVSNLIAAVFNVPLTQPGPLLSLTLAAGPGSPEQQQLYSLLSSLIKLSALPVGANSSDADGLSRSLSGSCLVTACAAIKLMDSNWMRHAHDSTSCNSTSTSLVLLSSSSSSSSSSTATQHSTGPLTATGCSTAPSLTSAIALLPSLVLVGRCCLLWAQHLQQALPQLLPVHDAGRGARPPQQGLYTRLTLTPTAPVLILLCLQPDSLGSEPLESPPATAGLQSAFSFVSHWLTAPAITQQLAAAGHDTQQLPQLCQELLSAHKTVTEAWASGNFSEATAMALVQQLQVTGRALAGLAVPTMCCNPSCSNITGPSDLQLVSGRSCLCGGCRTARYCSRPCQKAAWKQHKPACSALAAAAAAGATEQHS